MVLFARLVAEKWNISESLATAICTCFEQSDWPYYIHDYRPEIAAEVELFQIWEIFDFLSAIAALGPKKKRLINALKKDELLNDTLQRRIDGSTDPCELDDMLVAHRPNPRSRAQIALKRGLGPLADLVEKQKQEGGAFEDVAKPYVDRDPALKSVEDVVAGVRDVLAERFAYNETVRAMAREFCYDDGFLVVTPKNRKDPRFAVYADKELTIRELPRDEVLKLLWAEEQKHVRVKFGVQLFRITEVLRQHFVENPDAVGFDVICEAIDECWNRLLQSIVERDVKEKLLNEALSWALGTIAQKLPVGESDGATTVAVGIAKDGRPVCVAMNAGGRLLGASRDQRAPTPDHPNSECVAKFLSRYRPSTLVVVKASDEVADIEMFVRATAEEAGSNAQVVVVGDPSVVGICGSTWIAQKCPDLDMPLRQAYAAGLWHHKPLGLVSEIGAQHFSLHDLQQHVPADRLNAVVARVATDRALHQGIAVRDAPDSALQQYPGMPLELLAAIRARDIAEPFDTKADLLNVQGMTEAVYRNIAGYVVLPQSSNALDATLVHPYMRGRLDEIADDLKVSTEGLVVNPGLLNSYVSDDFAWQLYARKNVIQQLAAGERIAQSRQAPRRKLRLDELQEGMVVQGKVTNISAFGAFVNINAVCDGLIHISQLADTYVENPDQVVSIGETVHVRIVKIDAKKRRISLSMKGLGNHGPRVRPTADHITNLIDHFSNR